MKYLEILKTRKDEIVEKTLAILPDALAGDKANRTFYFYIDNEENLNVDYYYYKQTSIQFEENHFYTIRDYETPSPEYYGYENIEDVDFEEIGYKEQIEIAVENHIRYLQEKSA